MGKKSKRARRQREIETKIANMEAIVVGKLKPHQYEGLKACIDVYNLGKARSMILEPGRGKVAFVSTPGVRCSFSELFPKTPEDRDQGGKWSCEMKIPKTSPYEEFVRSHFEEIKKAISGDLGVPAKHLRPSPYLWPGIDTRPLTTSLNTIREALQKVEALARQKSTYEKLLASREALVVGGPQWIALRNKEVYIEQLKRELDYSKGQRDRLSKVVADLSAANSRSEIGRILAERRAEVAEAKLLNPMRAAAASPIPSDTPERIAKDLYGRLSKHFYRDRGSRLSRIEELLAANVRLSEESRALKTRISELEVDIKAKDVLTSSKTTEMKLAFEFDKVNRNLVLITDEERDTLRALAEGTAAVIPVNPNLGIPYEPGIDHVAMGGEKLGEVKVDGTHSPSEAENLRRSHVIEPEVAGNPGQRCDTCAHQSTTEFRLKGEPNERCLGCEPSRGADGWEQRNTITVPNESMNKNRTWIEMLDPATRRMRLPKVLLPDFGRIFELIRTTDASAQSIGYFVRTEKRREGLGEIGGTRLDIFHDGDPCAFMYITGVNCPDTIVARTSAWSYAPEKE